jgi:glycosyltransferase involved in cell wall biosynthesis
MSDDLTAASKALIVVPCYNEGRRFSSERFAEVLTHTTDLILVNDGSADNTLERLEEFMRSHPGKVQVLDLKKNSGKGEAVRQGILKGIKDGYGVVGYVDADLATPPQEILRLAKVMSDRIDKHVVLGSRVKLLGVNIERKMLRHYLGRVFATAASMVLGLSVYDTQCGAKFFRSSKVLESAFSEMFVSRWAFDVELIGRLLKPRDGSSGLSVMDFLEVPLQTWIHVGGSKLSPLGMIRAFLDLLIIGSKMRR